MFRYVIYALLDPRSGEPRYVGKSSSGMRRPLQHARPSGHRGSEYRARWLRSLRRVGVKPQIEILYDSPVSTGLDDAECFWIAEMRRRGFRMTNANTGGLGNHRRPSAATRRKMAESARRAIAKYGHPLTGRKASAEHRARLSVSHKGQVISTETRIKMSRAHGSGFVTDSYGLVFHTVTQAADFYDIPRSYVSMVLRGVRPHAYGIEFSRILV